MRVVVPFASERPKTRLAGVLSAEERAAFSRTMLTDVVGGLRELGVEPDVLATAPLDDASVGSLLSEPVRRELASLSIRVDDRPLTPAVNGVLETTDEPVAVVMADLALATPAALSRLFDTTTDSSPKVVLAPGRGGGTNAIYTTHPAFRTDYHGASYLDHRTRAREIGAILRTVDSYRLATDIDEPADLAEVLLHGGNRSARWLREAGFALAIDDGRVGVRRADGTTER